MEPNWMVMVRYGRMAMVLITAAPKNFMDDDMKKYA